VLAQSVTAVEAFTDHHAYTRAEGDQAAVVRKAAEVLGMKPQELLRGIIPGRRDNTVKEDLTPDMLEGVREQKISWLGLRRKQRRHYPNGALARTVLGLVQSTGRGATGLELIFDKKISGREVPVRFMRDGQGRYLMEERLAEIEHPPDIKLSLDRAIQYFAEAALEEAVKKHKAKGGAVLVQDPHSGELLAMAELPRDLLRNASVGDPYEPGSTFKVVVAAAALESKGFDPEAPVDCENGKWVMNSEVTIKDHEKHRMLGLTDIIRYSSNIGTAKLALSLGGESFLRYCRLFGFGYKTGIALPGESRGILDREPPKRRVRLANMAFGQGVSVTPVQLVSAYSAIANGGRVYKPHLVKSMEMSGREVPLYEDYDYSTLPFSAETLASIKQGLYEVINGHKGVNGTGVYLPA